MSSMDHSRPYQGHTMDSCEVSTGKRIRTNTKLIMRRAKKEYMSGRVAASKIGLFDHLPCCNTVHARCGLPHSVARAQLAKGVGVCTFNKTHKLYSH